MASLEVLVRGNTNGKTLPLESQTELLGLFLPRLRDGGFADTMRFDTNFEGRLAVQGSNDLAQTSDNVVEGVDFVVVKDDSPHFLLDLFVLGFLFYFVRDDGRDALFRLAAFFLRRP